MELGIETNKKGISCTYFVVAGYENFYYEYNSRFELELKLLNGFF